MVILGIDWGKIISVPFWLNVSPGDLSPLFEKMFLVVLLVCYLVWGATKFAERKLISQRKFVYSKFLEKVGNYFLAMAIAFTFIFFFRYEAIPFLGGRFWVLIWAIMGVIWLIYLVRYYLVEVPKQKKAKADKSKLRKYLAK